MNIRLKKFESHVLFWFALILAFSLFYGVGGSSATVLILAADHLMSLPLYMLSAYSIAYIALPKLLLNKSYWYFLPLFIILVLILSLAELAKTAYISMPLLFPEKEHNFIVNTFELSRAAFYILLPTVFFVTLKYLKGWHILNIQKKELESENLKNELQILKSQINPGFIIDLLEILKDQALTHPPSAAKGIEEVSELLSFILYESNQPKIDLQKEIRLIEIFISLQKMKRNEKLDIRFSRIGSNKNILIIPMTLFTLVEYLFKNLDEQGKTLIRLYLEVSGDNVDFWAESPDCFHLEQGMNEDKAITNLKKRMKLVYGKDYDFECKRVLDVHKLHLNFSTG